jgi:hypothetical protein
MMNPISTAGTPTASRGQRRPQRSAWQMAKATLLVVAFLLPCPAVTQPRPSGPLPPTDLAGLNYTNEFFPGTRYRPDVPTVESLLGYAAGQRAANSIEIERCLKAWAAAAPDRTRLTEYARSHEGRPLHYLIVTAPANRARLDEVQAGLAKLGDPRILEEPAAQQLIETLPAVAWLAYTIHGDETEGSDAALAVLYHLIAADDPTVAKLLERVVVIIDPLMNPDGRDRFLKMIAEHRGALPNVDDQSLLHDGYWPWGRGNHYHFDLNRDWIYAIHPETRGRIREVSRWNPVLFVDAHGMGAQDTHLFSPPREPTNPHMPIDKHRWGRLFQQEQAAAFDQRGLLYYHGEWNEEWYPGYSDAWASYRGAVGILYEQARIAEDGVRRPEGRILSYRESVQHHVIGSMANLATVQAHAPELLQSSFSTRKIGVDPTGPYARRTFALPPSSNGSRLHDFAALMQLEGLEVFQTESDLAVTSAVDQLGQTLTNQVIPAGSILIPNRQPLGHLVAAMLEFDPHLSPAALADERQELLRKSESRIYDTTAWNLTMFYGLRALTLPIDLPEAAKPFARTIQPAPGLEGAVPAPVAYIIGGDDDLSVTAAARLMERGLQVRVAEKPFRFDDRDFPRGSVAVTALDNRGFSANWTQVLERTVQELGLTARAVSHGLSPGDGPDLGGGHFKRLEPPRVALFARGMYGTSGFGSIWFVLDHRLGIRHSHLEESEQADLARYNVLVMPDRGGGPLPGQLASNLKDWVKAGGTLIAIGNAAANFITEKAEFSRVRALPEVLGKLPDYELAVFREWLGASGKVPEADAIWAHKTSTSLSYPWPTADGAHPEEKEMKKRDAWQTLFMPQGAVVAARIDPKHWLTFGCQTPMPVLYGHEQVLMAAEGVEVPIRLGHLTPIEKATVPDKPAAGAEKTEADAKPAAAANKPSADKENSTASESDPKDGGKKDKKETPRVGWAAVPEGYELQLRMSGLLWPEATHRLANAAYVTREPVGRGQVILFAVSPAFRAATRPATRVFLNALVYGPGYGAAQPVRP